MFERVFNRLGHGSVVEKNRGRRRGRIRGDEEEAESGERSRLFIFFDLR